MPASSVSIQRMATDVAAQRADSLRRLPCPEARHRAVAPTDQAGRRYSAASVESQVHRGQQERVRPVSMDSEDRDPREPRRMPAHADGDGDGDAEIVRQGAVQPVHGDRAPSMFVQTGGIGGNKYKCVSHVHILCYFVI